MEKLLVSFVVVSLIVAVALLFLGIYIEEVMSRLILVGCAAVVFILAGGLIGQSAGARQIRESGHYHTRD